MQKDYPYSSIADKNVSDEALLSAIEALGDVIEQSTFWSAIVDDLNYRPAHRRRCLFQLFRRHVYEGMTLSELAGILNDPMWLREKNVRIITRVHGRLPVRKTSEDTVFVIRLEIPDGNDSAIYLRISGRTIDGAIFCSVLKGKDQSEKYGKLGVLEIGYSEID